MHGDLRGDGIGHCGLQADWQSSSRALRGVVMVKNIQLSGDDVHRGHCSVTWHALRRSLTFRSICGGRMLSN